MADDDRTGMVQVELSGDDWTQRAEKLASLEAERFALIDKKRTHNAKWNEQLIQLREAIKQHTEEVDTHMAWVPAQTDIFANVSNGADEEPVEEAPTGRRRRGRRSAAERNATA